jgi:hypothetical protein
MFIIDRSCSSWVPTLLTIAQCTLEILDATKRYLPSTWFGDLATLANVPLDEAIVLHGRVLVREYEVYCTIIAPGSRNRKMKLPESWVFVSVSLDCLAGPFCSMLCLKPFGGNIKLPNRVFFIHANEVTQPSLDLAVSNVQWSWQHSYRFHWKQNPMDQNPAPSILALVFYYFWKKHTFV